MSLGLQEADTQPEGRSMTENKGAIWWTPTGWKTGPVPAAYTAMDADPEGAGMDYTKLMDRHGYTSRAIHATQEEFAYLDYTVRINQGNKKEDRPRHLWVEVMIEQDGGLSEFFVAHEHEKLFWIEKWPALLEICNRTVVLDDLRSYVKAFVAFVRHGHGEEVIDEYGTKNMEDTQRERERFARMREEKRKYEQKRKAEAEARAKELADL